MVSVSDTLFTFLDLALLGRERFERGLVSGGEDGGTSVDDPGGGIGIGDADSGGTKGSDVSVSFLDFFVVRGFRFRVGVLTPTPP